MDIREAIAARHSVRRFTGRKVEEEAAAALRAEIEEINRECGFHFALCLDEPEAFQANKPHYGSFSGARNYIALAAPKGADTEVGYQGERLVLLAQMLGLNTCWVALTFEKGKVTVPVGDGERLYDLIALGYGETQGKPHKSKSVEKCAKIRADSPQWFLDGVAAAMLAPTAMNQQRFYLEQTGEHTVRAEARFGPCSKTDLGIVKYHFEAGAGRENFSWD